MDMRPGMRPTSQRPHQAKHSSPYRLTRSQGLRGRQLLTQEAEPSDTTRSDLHDLAVTVADITTDHVYAHGGHPWNEIADSLAKRQAKRTDDSPQSQWTQAFHADRQRLRKWLHEAPDEDKRAFPPLTNDQLEATVPNITAEPHHCAPEYIMTSNSISVKLAACTFNARRFKEPKHTGRDQKRTVTQTHTHTHTSQHG